MANINMFFDARNNIINFLMNAVQRCLKVETDQLKEKNSKD